MVGHPTHAPTTSMNNVTIVVCVASPVLGGPTSACKDGQQCVSLAQLWGGHWAITHPVCVWLCACGGMGGEQLGVLLMRGPHVMTNVTPPDGKTFMAGIWGGGNGGPARAHHLVEDHGDSPTPRFNTQKGWTTLYRSTLEHDWPYNDY